jgi:DNA-binding winged helix-turn-helix (wHTH) protein/tetratricopeptide (TPR) repeat protein
MSLGKFPEFLLNFSGYEMSRGVRHSYRFNSFQLDVEDRRLFDDGVPVSLEPKVFDVLALLVENSGHLVEKDELLRAVWADSFVEEANVARVIYTLRKVLGEDENGNKFIETVAKKGYRFVAEVREISAHFAPKPENGHGKSSIAMNELPASEFAGIADEADLQAHPAKNEARLISKPGQNTRIVLFAVGFLSAVALLLLLSFNFRPDPAVNPNKVKSIAVLPVKPINTAARDEIYEIGIADSLIYRLSAAKNFIVRPLSATRKYTDFAQDPVTVGREQKTDYVLDSNYQIADGKIRVTAQLINVATGQVEETYKSEKDASSVFAMQDEIANEVGNKLLALFATAPTSPTAKRGTTNEEAYRLYLQGTNLTNKRNQADAQKAIEYFERAIRLDPNYALAYAGMAYAHSASGTLDRARPREAFEKGRAAVNKALELDANLADVYAVRGELKFKEWDFAGAEKDLRRAIELEPNNDLAHGVYAMWLNHHGRFEEALAEIEIALEIDPNSLVHQRERGRFLYFARRYDEAIVHLERVLEIDENFGTAFHWLIPAYEKKGDFAGAFEWIMKEQKRKNPESIEMFQKAYETGGWENVKRKILEFEKLKEPTAGSYYRIARHHALLNDKEQAFEYLNKAFEERSAFLTMLQVEPAFDSLRGDPRFDELLRRVGFM